AGRSRSAADHIRLGSPADGVPFGALIRSKGGIAGRTQRLRDRRMVSTSPPRRGTAYSAHVVIVEETCPDLYSQNPGPSTFHIARISMVEAVPGPPGHRIGYPCPSPSR